jgi:nucleoside-diphosphate kinase
MSRERTFSILKPDATERNITGSVNAVIEEAGFRIVAQKRLQLSRSQAEQFYAVHAARPFYGELVDYMISAPVVVQVLERDNAVTKYREIMGATNPANADEGTIRKLFAESIERNTVHGSDSLENAAIEIGFFFSSSEITA